MARAIRLACGAKTSRCAVALTALPDVYDALTSRRVYKDKMSHEKREEIILDGAARISIRMLLGPS